MIIFGYFGNRLFWNLVISTLDYFRNRPFRKSFLTFGYFGIRPLVLAQKRRTQKTAKTPPSKNAELKVIPPKKCKHYNFCSLFFGKIHHYDFYLDKDLNYLIPCQIRDPVKDGFDPRSKPRFGETWLNPRSESKSQSADEN